jgi:hypothetical protein
MKEPSLPGLSFPSETFVLPSGSEASKLSLGNVRDARWIPYSVCAKTGVK